MNWLEAVERTVAGLGYDLVDAEKGVGGLLRVYIDQLPATAKEFIDVDDCEKVTRQLQHVLEVENCGYERLEVSSPGLDRPLKKAADYARFVGEQVEITLKMPFKGRKKYRGELQALGDEWRLVLSDGGAAKLAKPAWKKPVRKAAARKPVAAEAVSLPEGAPETNKLEAETAPNDQALDFALDEVREARLVPVVDFKGRRFASQQDASPSDSLPGAVPSATPRSMDEVDGGRNR